MVNSGKTRTATLNRYEELPGEEDSAIHATRSRPKLKSVEHSDFIKSRTSLISQCFWWLLTTLLCVLIIVTVRSYEQGGNLTPTQKHLFNTISTGLLLVLGLNFFEAFKQFAKNFQTKLRAHPHLTDREKDLLENFESLTDVCILGWESRRKTWILLTCIAWILVNILAQIGVALVSLTYSMDDGNNYNDIYLSHGTVNASKLDCYTNVFSTGKCDGNDDETLALAHSYGDLARAYDCGSYNSTSDVVKSKTDYRYFCKRDQGAQEFTYRFNEYNPHDFQRAYPHFTDRTISASSGPCSNWTMIGEPIPQDDGILLYNFGDSDGKYVGNITIPDALGGFDDTTYIYRDLELPWNASTYTCGPRCLKIWAHKARGYTENSTFYECPITVGNATNTNGDSTLAISDAQARLAAAAIAITGRPSGLDKNGQNTWEQYTLYSFGSDFEIHFVPTDSVGANMAEAAIGSLAMMAFLNPQIQRQGQVPWLGSRLSVKWYYFIPLLAAISGVHLALMISGSLLVKNDDRKDAGKRAEILANM